MALNEACRNIAANYRFHWSVKGGLCWRLLYLTVYYLIFIIFRWGKKNRHQRCLDWLKLSGLSDKMIEVETPGCIRLRLDLHTAFDPLFSIFGEGDYFRREDFRPSRGQVVLDGGANVGVYAIAVAKQVGEGGLVVAIEPHPANFQLLSENARRNGLGNLRLIPAALDDHAGQAQLFLHERGINHSLSRRTGRSLVVETKTLDQIVRESGLDRVDVIKLDTEGNVPAVLRGARETMARLRPRIVFEKDSEAERAGLKEIFDESRYDCQDIRCFTYASPRP